MQASDYAEFRAFAAIVRHGSFTRAAAHLGVSPSALSQTIRNLEARLGVRLLNRTTRSVSPTEAGARLAERLLPILDDLAATAAAAAAPEGAPSGPLRINTTSVAARHVLAPIIGPFLARYPAVVLDLDVEDALVDIVAQGYDAGIRLGERLEQDMVAVPLGATCAWSWSRRRPIWQRGACRSIPTTLDTIAVSACGCRRTAAPTAGTSRAAARRCACRFTVSFSAARRRFG
jgi:DNA-binding transcriptional LysR family regulator